MNEEVMVKEENNVDKGRHGQERREDADKG